jgi:hypothetical protein
MEKTMLRITRHPKSRISNRLAIFAALLLLVTSLSEIGNTGLSSSDVEALLATNSVAESAPVSLQSRSSTKAKKNRNFKVSLFLFRNH